MMGRTISTGLFSSLLFLQGCCCGGSGSGIWDEAMNQETGDAFRDMEKYCEDVPEGPEKDALTDILDRGFVDANDGRLELWDVALFETALEEACMDDRLDASEVQVLENKYEKMLADE